MIITIDDLQKSYAGIVGNLIDFTEGVRNHTLKPKIHDLKFYFTKNSGWIKQKKADGHLTFAHKVTKVTVGYQAHSSSKDTTVSANIMGTLLDGVQKHINILGNDIFGSTTGSWSVVPNYTKALNRYNSLHNN